MSLLSKISLSDFATLSKKRMDSQNLFKESSDWQTYYYQNSMNDEFNQYMDYYIRSIKNYKKVLIVEDDALSFKVIQSFIKDYDDNVQCFYASNETDALDIINVFHCDLVIADYFIEGTKTGLDVCNRIQDDYPDIKCSIVSSLKYYQFQELLKYSQTEPVFFEKPISKNKILHFLDEVYGDRYV